MAALALPVAVVTGCLASRAGALKATRRLTSDADAMPYFQRLENVIDIQYFGTVTIGNQNMKALFDTGSFEVLVFGGKCTTCGKAVGYHREQSSTYTNGNHTETHSFGSGTCGSEEGFEQVELGPYVADGQPMWEVSWAKMPVLEQASFQAIVGVGPPGEPVSTAQTTLADLKEMEKDYQQTYGFVPSDIQKEESDLEEKIRNEQSKKALLETLNLTTFSSCLGRLPGTSGWLVWNDLDPVGRQNFVELHVAGKFTWSVQIFDLTLGAYAGSPPTILGCENGCGAIVDTGTSLLAFPSTGYQKLFETIRSLQVDCSDISQLPDLTLKVSGHPISFPPDSYIGQMTGQVGQELKKFIRPAMHVASMKYAPDNNKSRIMQLRKHRVTQCQLLLMDMGDEMTQLGPLAILGMPFFRQYYTTFVLGKDSEGHPKSQIHIAPANDQCRPVDSSAPGSTSLVSRRQRRARKVDVSKIRGPRYARHGKLVLL